MLPEVEQLNFVYLHSRFMSSAERPRAAVARYWKLGMYMVSVSGGEEA